MSYDQLEQLLVYSDIFELVDSEFKETEVALDSIGLKQLNSYNLTRSETNLTLSKSIKCKLEEAKV